MAKTHYTACSIDGCNNSARARTWCGLHWARWRKHGDVNYQAPPKITGPCDAAGCERDAYIRLNGGKYCNKHYQRLYTRGTLDRWERPAVKPFEKCSVDGCDSFARARNTPYCEMHYGRIRRNGHLDLIVDTAQYDRCQYCGTGTENGHKYCGSRCAARATRETPKSRECAVCGNEYDPLEYLSAVSTKRSKGRDRLVCSDECERLRDQEFQDKRRPVSGLNDAGRALRYKVFDRDQWVCQICGDPTDRSAVWPSPRYPTIDHIIPVILGGDHTIDNLQCAHALCNLKKHSRPPDDPALSTIRCD